MGISCFQVWLHACLGEIRELFEVGVAPVHLAMPARRVPGREQVHGLALIGVRHDPPPYPRDHRHHVTAAVKVSLRDHLFNTDHSGRQTGALALVLVLVLALTLALVLALALALVLTLALPLELALALK